MSVEHTRFDWTGHPTHGQRVVWLQLMHVPEDKPRMQQAGLIGRKRRLSSQTPAKETPLM